MSLLQNEDFLIWQLRTSYLAHDKDGVGERLINVETPALFNDPGIRAAGLADGFGIHRTYSPPIPVATAVASEYFQGPRKQARFEDRPDAEDGETGGMVTAPGSSETVGPRPALARRRRREQQEEDDSSDLSDESDDEPERQRAAQQIRFAKMPVRSRAGSSPIRSVNERHNPELTITEASKASGEGRLRAGSLGGGDPVKARVRRDTTTSSDMSSENELDPSIFKRRLVRPTRGNSASSTAPSIEEELEPLEDEGLEEVKEAEEEYSDDAGDDESSLSSLAETADSGSLLNGDGGHLASSSLADLIPRGLNIKNPDSPRKNRNTQPNTLQALPPPRPISTILPVSALGQAIKAQRTQPKDPVQAFAKFSGKGSPDALNIKIHVPSSTAPLKPFDVLLQKVHQDSESGAPIPVTVADAIGFCLWRYREDELKPELPREKLDANRWVLRLMDDDEVDYDFEALNRTANITQFTHNNNKPPRRRGGVSSDAFGLVEASEEQYIHNKEATPQYTRLFEQFTAENDRELTSLEEDVFASTATIVPKPFANTGRKGSIDLPPAQQYSTPRTGPPKLLKVHYSSVEAESLTATIEVSSDTYLAEVLDMVCKKYNLDRQHHYLRITGTTSVALLDRQVAAIGNRIDLDLVRRRFMNDGSGNIAGTPSSTPPNAPLALDEAVTPSKQPRRATETMSVHPLAQKQDVFDDPADFKRYDVSRKFTNSFFKAQKSVMLLESDSILIMPADAGRATLFDTARSNGKSITYHQIIHCKTSRSHPRNFKITTLRQTGDKKSKKLYEFEAVSEAESAEIIREIMRRAINLQPEDAKGVKMGERKG